MTPTTRRVLRAALRGLGLGLGLGALALAALAALRLRVDCGGLSAAECELQHTLAHEIARLQALAATGCALVAGGLYLALRGR